MRRAFIFTVLALVMCISGDTFGVGVHMWGGPGYTEWNISDDGNYVTVESSIIKARWCYNKTDTGWFLGEAETTGGCKSGDLVELYYKPTSVTRNLLFRNNQGGSAFDSLGFWELEEDPTVDIPDWNQPDYINASYPAVGGYVSHAITEQFGRVEVEITSTFQDFDIVRTYYVYPWGDITVHADLSMSADGDWAYMSRKFQFAGSLYDLPAGSATNPSNASGLSWGTNFTDDSEEFVAFTDGESTGNATYDSYTRVMATDLYENTVNYQYAWADAYSGFILDDTDGDDPDIIVMVGDVSIDLSPFQLQSTIIGASCRDYIESGIFQRDWHVDNAITVGMNYFYNCGPSPFVSPYSAVPWVKDDLGTWNEVFHIMFRTTTTKDDYTRIWRMRSANIAAMEPTDLVNATVALDDTDKLYHVTITNTSIDATFTLPNPEAISGVHDYVTTVVVENMSNTATASVSGPSGKKRHLEQTEGVSGAVLAISQLEAVGATSYDVTIAP